MRICQHHLKIKIQPIAVLLAVVLLPSCKEAGMGSGDAGLPDTGITRPEGWTEVSHGEGATPDYGLVFDQSQVNQITVVISPERWQTALDEMTEQLGEFGAGGGLGLGEIPPEAIDACVGLSPDDPCTVIAGPQTLDGTCLDIGGTLVCVPEGMGPTEEEEIDVADPSWVECTVLFGDQTWWHVGFRFKGNSTLSMTWSAGSLKLPFKLDIDEYEDDHPEIKNQRLFGFKRLAFTNNARDSSLLRDKVAGDLFREFGVPAPRRAFYRVYLDVGDGPAYFGLYTMAEVPDYPMLEAQFGDPDGNLYKPEGPTATFSEGFLINEESFSKKTNEEAEDWSDVEAAVAALHGDRSDPAAWRSVLETTFHVDGFLRWLAVNTVIQDWDSYGNSPRNYYLYGDPNDDGRLSWIPWDHNESLKSTGGMAPPIPLDLATVDEQWPLIFFLNEDDTYRARYWTYVQELSTGLFASDAMASRLQAEHDLIAPYVVGDDGEQPGYTVLESPEAFNLSVDALNSHVESRQAAVTQALNNR